MIQETLLKTNLPVQYRVHEPIEPPYLVYYGNGQNNLEADNTLYWRENTYTVEYYFTQKDEEQEESIEDILLADGFLFSKSEDIYLESEEMSVIYYYIGG